MKDKKSFTHIDAQQPSMVDVGDKSITRRTATAQAWVQLPSEMQDHIQGQEITTLKGPVFQTATLAGIQAAKRTSDLIPLCHNLFLNKVAIDIQLHDNLRVEVRCEARCEGKTGVEMEALTGASVAALTVYDMCKAFSHNIIIEQVRLLTKKGGKSDVFETP